MPFPRSALLTVALLLLPLALDAQVTDPAAVPTATGGVLIENRGQWNAEGRFLFRTGGLDAWVTRDGIVYDLFRWQSGSRGGAATMTRHGHVVRMRFIGADRGVVASAASDQVPGVHHYILGSDSARWVRGARLYRAVAIDRLYPGISTRVLADAGSIRYDVHVQPGADPRNIRFTLEGADSLSVRSDGALVMHTSLGAVAQANLFAFQERAGEQSQVACGFQLHGDGSVGFSVGAYDRTRPLVIDPVVFATYVGGAANEFNGDVAIDGSDNVYIAGTSPSIDYPTTAGAYDRTFDTATNKASDIVVTKIRRDGSAIVYSTFIGGDSLEGLGRIHVDRLGYAYIAGYTQSPNYPTTPGALKTKTDAYVNDIVVTKLDTSGGSLIYSTLIGGNDVEGNVSLAVDDSGFVHISGATQSADYPTTTGVVQRTFGGGGTDGFVTRLAQDGRSLVFSTFLGGNEDDLITSLAVDRIGKIFVSGYTWSKNFPVLPNALDTSFGGMIDAFVSIIGPNGASLPYSTLLGGSSWEGLTRIAIDTTGSVYITGSTGSSDFPRTRNAYDTIPRSQYAARLNPELTGFIYSTFLGGASNDRPEDAALARGGFFCFTGTTSSASYPVTRDAISKTRKGPTDAFISIVGPSGGTISFSSYLGGAGSEVGYGLAIDRIGSLYLAGTTSSLDFPVTKAPPAADTSANGMFDLYLMKIGRCFVTLNAGRDTSIYPGDTVRIGGIGRNGAPPFTYQWTSSEPLSPGDTTAEILVSPAQTAVYVLTTTDFLGCYASDTVLVFVRRPPMPNVAEDTAFCAGGSARLGSPATGGIGPLRYQWTPTTGLDNPTSPSPIARPTETTRYAVLVTDSLGGIGRDTVLVTVNDPPVLAPGGRIDICTGDTATLGITIERGNGPYRYRWSPTTNLSDPTAANPRAWPINNASYRVTVTDAFGCVSVSDAIEVRVGSDLFARIIPSRSPRLCEGESVTLDAGEYARYRWSTGDTTRQITVSTPGFYSVSIASATGCEGTSDTIQVSRAEPADATILGAPAACVGATVAYAARQQGLPTYGWRLEGGIGTIASTADADTLLVRWNTTGSATLVLVAMTREGCVDSARFDVTVTQVAPPVIATAGDVRICAGDSLVLDPGSSWTGFRWSTGETTRSIVVREAGAYWLEATNANGCIARSDTVTVIVAPLPMPRISASATEICLGDSARLSAPDGFRSYTWSTGERTQSITVRSGGSYTVAVADDRGCVGTSAPLTITVYALPAPPTITVRGDTLISSPASAYQWYLGGVAISEATEQWHVRRQSGSYTVTIIDSNGCTATSTPVAVEGHRVWLDSAEATLGQRVRLALHISPPLRSADGVTGYTVRLRVDPRDLYAHGTAVPASATGRLAPSLNAPSDGSVIVQQNATAPVTGDTVFLLELEGLATARPISRVTLESAVFDGLGQVEAIGNGVVTLTGCEVGGFAAGKRIRIIAATSHDGVIRVTWRAPLNSVPELLLVDAAGRQIAAKSLPPGTESDQTVDLDIATYASGLYLLELRDRDERASRTVVVTE